MHCLANQQREKKNDAKQEQIEFLTRIEIFMQKQRKKT